MQTPRVITGIPRVKNEKSILYVVPILNGSYRRKDLAHHGSITSFPPFASDRTVKRGPLSWGQQPDRPDRSPERQCVVVISNRRARLVIGILS